MNNNRISSFPKGLHQWIRLIIGILGIALGLTYYSNLLSLNKCVSIATILGFLGYTMDGLFKNVEERKQLLNKK